MEAMDSEAYCEVADVDFAATVRLKPLRAVNEIEPINAYLQILVDKEDPAPVCQPVLSDVALFTAIENNDPQLVKSLLEQGFDPNAEDAEGHTALTLSLTDCQKFKDIINVLLEWSGTDVNKIDGKGNIALNLAIEQNNLPVFEKILAKGADIQVKDGQNRTPVNIAGRLKRPNILHSMFVANYKHVLRQRTRIADTLFCEIADNPFLSALHLDAPYSILEFYIWAKSREDKQRMDLAIPIILQTFTITSKGRSVFTLAVEKNCRGFINYVLSFESICPRITNEKDVRNESPLSIALSNDNLQLVELLLQNCADPNLIEGKKLFLNVLIKRNCMEGIKLLIVHGADVNMTEPEGHNPLTQAVKSDNLEVINYLLDKGADVNLTNGKGYSPLTTAVICSHFDIASLLIERGAQIDSSDDQGNTPLIIAVKEENAIAVNFLLQNGASINCPNNEGWTPIRVACDKKCWDLVQLLRERGADLNEIPTSNLDHHAIVKKKNERPFSSPIFSNDDLEIEEVELLSSIKGTTVYNNRLLNTFIKRNSLDEIKWFIDHDDTVLKLTEPAKHTPLTQAVKCNNLDVINYLLDKGADVNLMNGKRYTPLTTSVRYSNEIVASLLLEKGAEVDMCDGFGKTPLTFAIEKENIFLVNVLLDNGASINLVNGRGYTPLTTAIKINSWELVKMLKKRGADVNLEDKDGHTPITFATALNLVKISVYLINECHVDVNSQGWFGSTALLNAIAHKNEHLVQLLLSEGADVGLVDWKGRRPMVEAVKADCLPILNALTSAERTEDDDGSDISFNWLDLNTKPQTPLSQAVALNNSEVVGFLLQNHAHTKNSGLGSEMLNEAIGNADLSAMEVLLKNGVNVNVLERVIQKDNPSLIDCVVNSGGIKPEAILPLAIAECAFNIISHCVDSLGIGINSVDEDGSTPLTKSIGCNNATVEFLIEKGADVNQIDGNGFTPLTKALEVKQFQTIKLLVENHADVSKMDGNNVKPLAKAVDIEDQKIIDYIFIHMKTDESTTRQKLVCRICYESFANIQAWSTTCGHLFCRNCLSDWLQEKVTGPCPICRTDISLNSIHSVFF